MLSLCGRYNKTDTVSILISARSASYRAVVYSYRESVQQQQGGYYCTKPFSGLKQSGADDKASMVKGNWERRAELAALRREEEKALKAQRKERESKPRVASAESILVRLKREGPSLRVWLARPGAEECCQLWFRTGFCELKKCRFAHTQTLGLPLPLVEEGLEHHGLQELACEGPVEATALSPKDVRFVHFIALGDRALFDWARPQCWEGWAQGRAMPSLRALSITEGDEAGDVREDGKEEGQAGGQGRGQGRGQKEGADKRGASGAAAQHACPLPPMLALLDSKRHAAVALGGLLAFLDVQELCRLQIACQKAKKAVQADAPSRERRRAAFGLVSGEVSRGRKQDRRKRQKGAFLGSADKVDAYARGIPR